MTTIEATSTLTLTEIFRTGPLVQSQQYFHLKDPSPVFDGTMWHIFATGKRYDRATWHLFHAVSETLAGPWQEVRPAIVFGDAGNCFAAPGMVYDSQEKLFHMFIQTDCFALGTRIEHHISKDGNIFTRKGIVLESMQGTDESGIYDPHPAEINGKKYITYSGMKQVGRPDIYLLESESNTWAGPWRRLGCILSHEDVSDHHNQHNHEDYEWGLEGSQLVELPDGQVLLNAVCFLPQGSRGTRQRVFFALADSVTGPYTSLGPIIQPQSEGWESGENGHAAAIIYDNKLHLFYQARGLDAPWLFGHKTYLITQVTTS